mgnify:CR=1 FL=1
MWGYDKYGRKNGEWPIQPEKVFLVEDDGTIVERKDWPPLREAIEQRRREIDALFPPKRKG